MNRRDLLKYLGAAAAASVGGLAIIDTHKTFFLPPAGGWHRSYLKQYIVVSDALPAREDVLYGTNMFCQTFTIECWGAGGGGGTSSITTSQRLIVGDVITFGV